jgi:transposase
MLKRLGDRYGKLHFVYEADPCGYGIYRQINAAGHVCEVPAAHTARRAGDRVKTDRRDGVTVAPLPRAGELTLVWVPGGAHEALRDLIRACDAVTKDVRQVHQRVPAFLLLHEQRYAGAVWKKQHRVWLATQSFDHPARKIAFQTYLDAMDQAHDRKDLIEKHIEALSPEWSLGLVGEALLA